MSKENEKIEVTKIVIRMGNRDAELTIAQARELKDALNELLGEKSLDVIYVSPTIIERPYRPNRGVTWKYILHGEFRSGTVTYSLSQ
jgi:hypothetical protein